MSSKSIETEDVQTTKTEKDNKWNINLLHDILLGVQRTDSIGLNSGFSFTILKNPVCPTIYPYLEVEQMPFARALERSKTQTLSGFQLGSPIPYLRRLPLRQVTSLQSYKYRVPSEDRIHCPVVIDLQD